LGAGPVALAEESGVYTPGTYSAQADGIGKVTVTMTFDANSITDVVLDVSNETPSIGQLAEEELREALMAAQGAEIDAVSGATVTSQAVKKSSREVYRAGKGRNGC
jgi:uncharacterized protein with FMN-binding domain